MMLEPKFVCRVLLSALVMPCIGARIAHAQSATEIAIDATQAPPPVETGFLRQGTNTAPDGHTIGVTNRYLTRDGKPWLPVMGEFHYSRYPEADWEKEILKMKAGGVDIVASYVIWIHHEEEEGKFDWTGQRNLRRFVELIGKHGLYAYPRIGPWSHAEVRNGGLPDWVLEKVGTEARSNDSTYLSYSARYYAEIGKQLRGLLWKEGGPIIGIQLENEYHARGPLRGEEHITELKRLALQAGFDVPLYTVTGWDNAVLPQAEVIPVFGGYPDMPWDQSIQELPPGEVYAFRFANRWAGERDARNPVATSHEALSRYPFLGAEYGGGIQITYHRRPVIAAADIAAMLPVQIGSGNNLYGYYMFHGGTNPPGKLTTLQESQRTGYPTDVPVKSYDFQTLLSEFGEMRSSFRKVKLVHYFLNEFGHELAPMVVRQPDVVPASTADTSVLRLSARTLDNRGYIFVNNYVRNYRMPARSGVQVTLRLLQETLRVPNVPIDVPSGAYFIWPVNTDLHGVTLKYSTAQLFTRMSDSTLPVYFFFAVPGIDAEFAFDEGNIASLDAPGATVTREDGRIYVRRLRAGTAAAISIRANGGQALQIVLLTREQAENTWRVELVGTERLLMSPQEVFSTGEAVHLRAIGAADLSFAVFPAFEQAPRANATLSAQGADGVFTRYSAALPARQVTVVATRQREADAIPPVKTFNAVTWRKVEIALAPSDSAFDQAARYRIDIPADALSGLDELFLEIRYIGDVARLYSGNELLNDNFFNGTPWRLGLKRYDQVIKRGPLELRILPLRADAPIYIPKAYWPSFFPAAGQAAEIQAIEAFPAYELVVQKP